jgi:hypothetical protein
MPLEVRHRISAAVPAFQSQAHLAAMGAEAIHERKLASAPKAPLPQRRAGNAPPIAKPASSGAATWPPPGLCPLQWPPGSRRASSPPSGSSRTRCATTAAAPSTSTRSPPGPGTCRTVVKNALRAAQRAGMVTVTERRRRGQRSLTNIIHIISREWREWLVKGGGVRKTTTTDIRSETQTQNRGFGGSWGRYYRHYDPGNAARKRYGRA